MPDNNISQEERYAIMADEWFKNAADALGYAKTGLPDTSFYSWICFLCQQSAELYLKGFLVLHGIEPPRIHDLVKLLKLCEPMSIMLFSLHEQCRTLTDYYIETRYLPEVKAYSNKQAQEAVRLASAIETAIMELRRKKK